MIWCVVTAPTVVALHGGGCPMQIFVTQGRYSREAIKGMSERPEDRGPVVAELCERAGGRLLGYYLTFGEHDLLIVSEMPGHRKRLRSCSPRRPAGCPT